MAYSQKLSTVVGKIIAIKKGEDGNPIAILIGKNWYNIQRARRSSKRPLYKGCSIKLVVKEGTRWATEYLVMDCPGDAKKEAEARKVLKSSTIMAMNSISTATEITSILAALYPENFNKITLDDAAGGIIKISKEIFIWIEETSGKFDDLDRETGRITAMNALKNAISLLKAFADIGKREEIPPKSSQLLYKLFDIAGNFVDRVKSVAVTELKEHDNS